MTINKRHDLLEQGVEVLFKKDITNKEKISRLVGVVGEIANSDEYKRLLLDDMADLNSNIKLDIKDEMILINKTIIKTLNDLQDKNIINEHDKSYIIQTCGLEIDDQLSGVKFKYGLKDYHFNNLEDSIKEFNDHKIQDKKLDKLTATCVKTLNISVDAKDKFLKEFEKTNTERTVLNDKLSKQQESLNRADKAFSIAERELNTTNQSISSSKTTIERNNQKLAEMNIFSRIFSSKAKDLKEINQIESKNIKEKTKDLVGDTEFYNQSRNEKQKAVDEYNKIESRVNTLEAIENKLNEIDSNLKEINENLNKMPNMIKLIDIKKTEIDAVNIELKDLAKQLKQMAKSYPHMDDEKNKKFDELTREYESLISDKEGLQVSIESLKGDYDKMQTSVDKCQQNIIDAKNAKDSIFKASNHINSAHLESNKLVEMGKSTLEKSKGILLQLGGAMLSLSTLGLANSYANKLMEKGSERVNEAKSKYQEFQINSKEHKEQSKDLEVVTKNSFEMNL